MNIQGISDYSDYLNILRHEFCISTGKRQEELRKILMKEIAEKYEHDHPRREIVDENWEEPKSNHFHESSYLDQVALAAGY